MGKADNKAELAQALYIPLVAWERWLGRWRDVYLPSKRDWYALRNVDHKRGSCVRWHICHVRFYWRLQLGSQWCFGFCQLFCRQVSSTLLMQSCCWLICQWLHWHQGFQLNPLGFAWLIALCWVRLGTVKLLKQPEGQGCRCLWLVGRGQCVVWRDVSWRGLQNASLSAVERSEGVPLPRFWVYLKFEAKDYVCSGWLECLLPPLPECPCSCISCCFAVLALVKLWVLLEVRTCRTWLSHSLR